MRALVLGAGGFIGSHMVRRLKAEGYWVRGVDLKKPEFSESAADEFLFADLTDIRDCRRVLMLDNEHFFANIYQFAADMGGAGYIFSGENDANVMHNSLSINLNVLRSLVDTQSVTQLARTKVFFSSSACVYPEHNQTDPSNPNCLEETAYPANPDSEYGWEKLTSERLYFAYERNYGIQVSVARFHNIFGIEGTWRGGREKSPAAICRKIALLPESGGVLEVWGDGKQTRSFLYIDDCIEAVRRLVRSSFGGPVNIGSEEMVTINQMIDYVQQISGKSFERRYILDAPTGVRGRNSNNDLIRKQLNWNYELTLREGLSRTYKWIEGQIEKSNFA